MKMLAIIVMGAVTAFLIIGGITGHVSSVITMLAEAISSITIR